MVKKFPFVVILFISGFCHAGSMTFFSGSVVDDSSVGTNAWTNPSNAAGIPDGNYASESGTSHYLSASQFAANIPVTSSVTGIVATIYKFSPNLVLDVNVRLFVNGVATGNNKANVSSDWPSSLTAYTYGSSTDTWGVDLSPSIINSSNFGVGISIQKDAGGINTGNVDAISLTFYGTFPTTITNGVIRNGTLR